MTSTTRIISLLVELVTSLEAIIDRRHKYGGATHDLDLAYDAIHGILAQHGLTQSPCSPKLVYHVARELDITIYLLPYSANNTLRVTARAILKQLMDLTRS